MAQKVTSAPFNYLPEAGPDRYDLRVPRKTLPLTDGSGFVILAHQAEGSYAVERYDRDLKKRFSTAVAVAAGETLEAFGRSAQQAWVVLHHKDESNQNLTVVPVNLETGQRGPRQNGGELRRHRAAARHQHLARWRTTAGVSLPHAAGASEGDDGHAL